VEAFRNRLRSEKHFHETAYFCWAGPCSGGSWNLRGGHDNGGGIVRRRRKRGRLDLAAAAEAFSRDEPFRKAGLFGTVKISRMRRGQWNPAAAPKSEEGH
jgi:hypothetical protein